MANHYYEWSELTFESDSSGYLTCLECGEWWCEHTQLAMVQNLDAEFVWDDLEEGFVKTVQIPMFPTQNLWIAAGLLKIEGLPFARLKLLKPNAGPTKDMLEIDVSYLHPGEGRNVIRTTFIDYMLTDRVVTDTLICKSPSHKFRQEKLWQERTHPKNKHRTAEYWSVWEAKACIECRGLNDTAFDPDLVPDDTKKSIW